MQYTDDRYRLRVEIDARDCNIPPDELSRMQNRLASVGEVVKEFPSSELTVKVIRHPDSNVYHDEFRLRLPGKTLFTGDSDPDMHRAFDRGVRKLVWKTTAYSWKGRRDTEAETVARREAALDRNIVAPTEPDAGPLGQAARDGDYQAFRTRAAGYEEWLRDRVGRWVQRYPEAQARIGGDIAIGDLLEEVYLNAFEQFPNRRTDIALHEWFDGLIDPSLKLFLRHPDREAENADMVRSLRPSPQERTNQ